MLRKALLILILIIVSTACARNWIDSQQVQELNIASLKSEANLVKDFRNKFGTHKLTIFNQQLDRSRGRQALLDGAIDIFIGDIAHSKVLEDAVVAKEALLLITNQDNPVNNLSQQNLQDIFSRKIKSWAELGGRNEPILIVDQASSNPAHGALYKSLFGKSPDFHASSVVNGAQEAKVAVEKFSNAISYISFGQLDSKVKALNIDNLPPSHENINEGYYPLAREIKLYYNPEQIKKQGKLKSLKKFLSFVYRRGQEIVAANDYMPLTTAELELIKVGSDPIYIGLAVPLEGPYLELSKSVVNAAKLAVEQVNELDGIASRPIELIICNDKASAAQAVICANKFVANEVVAVIGHMTSQASIEASKIYVKHKIVQISPASTHPWFTERPGARGYVYRTIARDDKQAELITSLLDQLGLERPVKVTIFNNGTIYGSTLSTLIENSILKIGQDKVLDIVSLEQDAHQYQSEIEALKGQVLIFVGEYGAAAKLVKELALSDKKDIKFIGADGVFSPSFIDAAGLRSEGAYVTGSTLGQDSKSARDFEVLFEQRYKVPVSAFAMNSYDATNILIEALKASHENKTSLQEEMHKTKYEGVTGTISFDQLGDPNQERMCIYRVIEGKFVKQ